MRNYNILVVDDEPLIRESLYEILRIEGYNAQMASTGEDAIKFIRQQKNIDIVVTDMKLPQMSGIDLLEHIQKEFPEIDTILITGFGTIETAVNAMKMGAYDYITKPINDNQIKLLIKNIVERKELLNENENLRSIIAKSNPSSFCDMIGQSEKMHEVYHIIQSVANSNATILITGQSGTGKGLVARAIHETDEKRNNKPFVEISCGALSETLLESELFGHVKGAFTGAIKDKQGRFEFAKGGTIFLDEIDAFSPALQVKLLRVLQDGIFERVGDNEPRKADVRIIVATNRFLPELVKDGEFREDLYYRVNVISIEMPPLKERKEDLPMLIDHFIKLYSQSNKKAVTGLSPEVKETFLNYSWPGNIRELENAIEGSIIMSKGTLIEKKDIPNIKRFNEDQMENDQTADGNKTLKDVIAQPEKEMIESVLEQNNWNRNKAAEALGINRTTLYNKMKKYNIDFKKSR